MSPITLRSSSMLPSRVLHVAPAVVLAAAKGPLKPSYSVAPSAFLLDAAPPNGPLHSSALWHLSVHSDLSVAGLLTSSEQAPDVACDEYPKSA